VSERGLRPEAIARGSESAEIGFVSPDLPDFLTRWREVCILYEVGFSRGGRVLPTIEIEGRQFAVDGDGFLEEPGVWDEGAARLLAVADGTGELTEKHWAVVRYIRAYWQEHGMAPMVRKICQHTGLRLTEIYAMFPLGPAKGACKIAGLPKPDGCV
jgi:TusE/DsrC/DsvC family sulfur relay protein